MWPSPEAQNATQGRRIPRREFDAHVAALEEQRDRAIGQRRAHHDWVTSWLEQRADSHEADARHAHTPADRRVFHGAVAHTLRELAQDIERGQT